VRDIDARMEDEEIIRTAVTENRMVITMDKDFGELVYHSSMEHSGVLLLRLEDATGTEKLLKEIRGHYTCFYSFLGLVPAFFSFRMRPSKGKKLVWCP
jgi:predicted nuclease of predicted toxin-antitoxin system